MANEAKVRSLDALESWRSSLIVFMTKARRAVDQAGEEVRRARNWVQTEQRLHWETELRKRTRKLEQFQAELLTARLSSLTDSTTVREMAVRKAKAAVDEAQQKLMSVKRWSRDFDRAVAPLTKKMEALHYYLEQEMPKAVAYMAQAQRTLEAYADVSGLGSLNDLPTTSEESPTPIVEPPPGA